MLRCVITKLCFSTSKQLQFRKFCNSNIDDHADLYGTKALYDIVLFQNLLEVSFKAL